MINPPLDRGIVFGVVIGLILLIGGCLVAFLIFAKHRGTFQTENSNGRKLFPLGFMYKTRNQVDDDENEVAVPCKLNK